MNQERPAPLLWHELWRSMMDKCTGVALDQNGSLKRWHPNDAKDYLQHSSPHYPKALNQLINIQPTDNILDIGCGPGVLALPFSKLSKTVTVVDISPGMLNILKQNAAREGVVNIKYVNKFWLETHIGEDIADNYDIVLSSNSINLLGIQESFVDGKPKLSWDLATAIEKMNQVGKRVYISFPAAVHDYSAAFKSIGKQHHPWPSYTILHNMLYQMGLRPNVDTLHFTNPNIDKNLTIRRVGWAVNLTPQEKTAFQTHLKQSQERFFKANQTWGVYWWKTQNHNKAKSHETN
ncbi:MAG: class I SAM-dependent methyltransferase [Candidatus Bathyarchaeota archaeon]|nr:class I SAM-dependent methyltransferase [Candidatus Bathyarchaeota archaeon]